MKLRGISLAESKPKNIRLKQQTDSKIRKAEYNKKYYRKVTKKKRKEKIKLDGHSKLEQSKRTYWDVFFAHNKEYLKMNVLEQEEYRRRIKKEIYAGKQDLEVTPLAPLFDRYKDVRINYNVVLKLFDRLSLNHVKCLLLLSAFIDRTDGIIRTAKNGYITVNEMSQLFDCSTEKTKTIIYSLNRAQVIYIQAIHREEFKDIYEWEAEKLEYADDIAASLAKREYRIYVNPFVIFVNQYIDKDIAENEFYGSEWVLYNKNATRIIKWIERNCE